MSRNSRKLLIRGSAIIDSFLPSPGFSWDKERGAIMATVQAPPRARIHEGPFVNEPLTDFTREENARKMRAAIEKVRSQLGREYDLIIGGRPIKTQDKLKSINSAKPSVLASSLQKAGKE